MRGAAWCDLAQESWIVPIAGVPREIQRFASSFHAHRQARKKRFSLEDASCPKAWIRRSTSIDQGQHIRSLESFRQVVVGEVAPFLKIDKRLGQFPDFRGDREARWQPLRDAFLERPTAERLAGILHDSVGEGPSQDLTVRRLVMLRPDLDSAGLVDQHMEKGVIGRRDRTT